MNNNSKLVNKPNKLNFVIKKKGEPDVIEMPNNEITEQAGKYYFEKRIKAFWRI